MLKQALEKLLAGSDLDAEETSQALAALAAPEGNPALAGAFLTALRMRGETVAELVGGAALLRRTGVFIDCGGRDCVDIVGTGGDGGISFNISTTAAIAAAGAGVNIAKHGNRAVSGKSGAADMLAACGYNLDAPPESITESIAGNGIGFLFAARLHPLMGRVAPLRKALGIRTIFNLLGPLANPAGVRRMVAGVYSASLVELYAAALRELGVEHAMVVHGLDGLDEISCCAPTRIAEVRDGEIRTCELACELLTGGVVYDPSEIAGGTPAENAVIARNVLSGRERGARRAAVVLNAAAACCVGGLAESMAEAVELVSSAIDDGRAIAKLEALVEGSRK